MRARQQRRCRKPLRAIYTRRANDLPARKCRLTVTLRENGAESSNPMMMAMIGARGKNTSIRGMVNRWVKEEATNFDKAGRKRSYNPRGGRGGGILEEL